MPEVAGYGTTFGYGTVSGTYTSVAEVVEVNWPEDECDDIDTTHMLTTNKVRTYQAGLVEPGEAEVIVHFDKTVYGAIRALRGLDRFFCLTYSDNSKEEFGGYVKKVGPETPIDGIVTYTVTIKVSGEKTYTAAS